MPPEPMQPHVMGYPGPSGPPTQNPGMQAQGMTMVREAVQLLQKALMAFPIGSEEHESVMNMITKGAKLAPASSGVPGVQATALQGLAQDAQKQAMMQALMRRQQEGGGGAPGGAPPPGGAPGGAPPPQAS